MKTLDSAIPNVVTEIRDALAHVIDPELDCNIVDLGLVHDVVRDGSRVKVIMTLTTPGCPMQQSLVGGVQAALLSLEGVEDVQVDLVWYPPWTPERITAEGRAVLGME